MKTIITITLCILFPFSLLSQTKQLKAFHVLAGHKWISEGLQLEGHQGKTEHQFELGLDGNIIKVKTYTTDPKTLEYGLKNEGIRAWNAKDKTIYFYEFDKKGELTTGTIITHENNIYYDSKYGHTILRKSWEYVDDNTYQITVGTWDGKAWKQKFYETKFTKVKNKVDDQNK